MRRTPAVVIPFLLLAAGCLSPPIPQELVDVGATAAAEPLSTKDIVRLSKAGLPDEVIVDLMRTRGLADRPSTSGIAALAAEGVSPHVQVKLLTLPVFARPKPQPRIVYHELYLPLWPAYYRGRWHWGLRIGCYYRTADGELQEILPEEPTPAIIDP